MRWLKHLSTAHNDEEMDRILEECGAEGYGAYWLIIEEIAGPMEPGKMEPSAVHSDATWARLTHTHPLTWKSLKQKLGSKLLVVTRCEDGRTRIACPNILKYKDEYSRKSGQTRELSRSRAEAEADTEQTQRKPEQIDATTPASVSCKKWPLAGKAVQRRFPAADSKIVDRIAQSAAEVDPGITDERLACVIEFSYRKSQTSPGLFLKTVPETLRRNPSARPRASPEDERMASEKRAREAYARSDPQTRSELLEIWPEIVFEGGAGAKDRTA